MRKLIASEEYDIKNIGHGFKIKLKDNDMLPEEGYVPRGDIPKLFPRGEVVEINGKLWKIGNTETFASPRIWTVGLMVEEIEDSYKGNVKERFNDIANGRD